MPATRADVTIRNTARKEAAPPGSPVAPPGSPVAPPGRKWHRQDGQRRRQESQWRRGQRRGGTPAARLAFTVASAECGLVKLVSSERETHGPAKERESGMSPHMKFGIAGVIIGLILFAVLPWYVPL